MSSSYTCSVLAASRSSPLHCKGQRPGLRPFGRSWTWSRRTRRGNHSLTELAKHLNVSTRHLTRLFHEELSTTPARYVENIRFDIARSLLDQGHNATRAAALAGFPSYESMRRVFAKKLSISPVAYQSRFSSARRTSSE